MFRNPRGSAMEGFRSERSSFVSSYVACSARAIRPSPHLTSAVDELPLPLDEPALFQDPAVVAREDLDEPAQRRGEVIGDLVADLRSGIEDVAVDHVAEHADVLVVLDR